MELEAVYIKAMEQPSYQAAVPFFRQHFSLQGKQKSNVSSSLSSAEYILDYAANMLTLWRHIRSHGKSRGGMTGNRSIGYLRWLVEEHFVDVRNECDQHSLDLDLTWNEELTSLLSGKFDAADVEGIEADRRISKLIIDAQSALACFRNAK